MHMQGVYSVAYAPLGVPEGRIEGVAPSLKEKPILEVAEATGRSPAQVRCSLCTDSSSLDTWRSRLIDFANSSPAYPVCCNCMDVRVPLLAAIQPCCLDVTLAAVGSCDRECSASLWSSSECMRVLAPDHAQSYRASKSRPVMTQPDVMTW